MKKIICTIITTSLLIANGTNLEKSIINSSNIKQTVNNKKLNIGQIFKYIKNHRKYIYDYNLATLNLSLKSQENRYHYDNTSYSNDGRVDNAYIEFKYPLYDGKKQKDMINDKIKNNQYILNDIKIYFQSIDNLKGYINTIEFYQKKLEVELNKPENQRGHTYIQNGTMTTIINNEDYYSEKILEAKNQILTNLNVLIAKEALLDLVKEKYRNGLEELL